MTLIPLKKYIVAEPYKPEKTGLLILAEEKYATTYVILALPINTSEEEITDLKIGDKIIVERYSPIEQQVGDKIVFFIPVNKIIGVML